MGWGVFYLQAKGKSIVTGGGKVGSEHPCFSEKGQSHMISHLIQSHQIKKAFTFVFPWSFSIMELQYSSPQVSSADYFFQYRSATGAAEIKECSPYIKFRGRVK